MKKYPPNCSVSNNKYIVYRPRAKKGDTFPTDKGGRLKPPIRIGVVGDKPNDIYREYLKAVDYVSGLQGDVKNSLHWMNKQYQESTRYQAKKSKNRDKYSMRILKHILIDKGQELELGQMLAKDVTTPLIRAIADMRFKVNQEKGLKGSAKVNHELRYLSAMFKWSIEYIENLGIVRNPCQGIKKFKEDPNTRYVTNSEYAQQLKQANDVLKVLFEILYCTAGRTIEARDLRLSDITQDGLLMRRRKGSKTNIVAWSQRLSDAVTRAKELRNKYAQNRIKSIDKSDYLLVNQRGYPWSSSAINSAMQRLKKQVSPDVYWSLHLLKSKAISDAENKNIGGHKSEAMKQRYNTKTEIVEPPK